MTELAIDEPDATIVTVPRSEVVFMSQMILIFNLLTFCFCKLSWTQISYEETSVWFSILSGLVGYEPPNPRI